MRENSSLDPVALDPDKFEVRMHWHPPHLIYTLSPYKVQDTFTDGSTKTMERGAGELLWGEELTHATQNVGETGVHALIIEFKG